MTTKTIPAYLEDERQRATDTQRRVEEEAARIQPLHHGHHRRAKEPESEAQPAVRAVAKPKKTAVASRRKPSVAGKKVIRARKKV